MSFHANFSRFFKKTCLFITVFAVLKIMVFPQLTAIAAQSPNSDSPNDFTVWCNAILVLGSAFCASIFWWRREKAKEQTFNSRTPGRQTAVKEDYRKPRPQQKSKTVSERNEIEVDADFANWMRTNLDKKPINKSASSVQQTNSATVSSANNSAKQKAAPVFQIPAANPITPLPFLEDEFLLEAAEQVQDFDATEEERELALNVLSVCKSSISAEALATVAHYDESSRLRIAALEALGAFDHESIFEPVLLTCTDPAREVRAAGARVLTRLNINRGEAFNRIVDSGDSERLRLAAMACVDAGLANHAFDRLLHEDEKQSNEAFAIIRLLAAAEQFAPIFNNIANASNVQSRLATIQALRTLKPIRILPELLELIAKNNLPAEVRKAAAELIDELKTR